MVLCIIEGYICVLQIKCPLIGEKWGKTCKQAQYIQVMKSQEW